jgi:hypothetical protein
MGVNNQLHGPVALTPGNEPTVTDVCKKSTYVYDTLYLLTYSRTYLLTLWSTVLLENLTGL